MFKPLELGPKCPKVSLGPFQAQLVGGQGKEAPRLFNEAHASSKRRRASSKRRTPLHLGLQTALSAVCIGSCTHYHQPTPTSIFDSGGHSGGKRGGWCALRGCVSGCCFGGKGMRGCLNREGRERRRELAILQLGEIERVFWRETEGKERKNVGEKEKVICEEENLETRVFRA